MRASSDDMRDTSGENRKYRKGMLGKFFSTPYIPNPRWAGEGVICFNVILIFVDLKGTEWSGINIRREKYKRAKWYVWSFFNHKQYFLHFSPCARDHNNDKVNFEVLYLHTRCTLQKQFNVDHLVNMPEREKLKTQNCKRIRQRAWPLHDRKWTLKQLELQITEQENRSRLLQNAFLLKND